MPAARIYPHSGGSRLPHVEPRVKAGPGEPRNEALDLPLLIGVAGADVELMEETHAQRTVPSGRQVALRRAIGIQLAKFHP